MPIMIQHQKDDPATSLLQDIFEKKLIPCTQRNLQKGEFLWRSGESHQYCYFIRSGMVKLFVYTADGREKDLIFHSNGTFFGFQNLSENKSAIASAVTMLPTTLYGVEFSNFYAFISHNTIYLQALTKYLWHHVAAQTHEIVDISFSNTDERLAALLVTLADSDLRSKQGEVVIPLNNDELAAMVGACRNSICNVLLQFQKKHLIRKSRGKVVIMNLAALREFQNERMER